MIEQRPKLLPLLAPLLAASLVACTTQRDPDDDAERQQAAATRGATIVYPAENLPADAYDPGPGWRIVWADEFDGPKLDPDKWIRQVEPAERFNGEWQRYTDSTDNADVENGVLVIRAIHEGGAHAPNRYTSARLHTPPADGWRYGRIAARIQLPWGQGIWPAFWMLGANIDENGGDTPWPRTGEIDILELYGSRDNGRVEANIHYADGDDRHASMGSVGFDLEDGWFADAFHVFEIVWDEDRIVWFVDGQRYAETSLRGEAFDEFREPFFILLNIAVGGRAAGPPGDASGFPQRMLVDWVRIYQR
ncbi:MAG: glycoside hydrolase family 16 protein [Pseudomonadota bacterium]